MSETLDNFADIPAPIVAVRNGAVCLICDNGDFYLRKKHEEKKFQFFPKEYAGVVRSLRVVHHAD